MQLQIRVTLPYGASCPSQPNPIAVAHSRHDLRRTVGVTLGPVGKCPPSKHSRLFRRDRRVVAPRIARIESRPVRSRLSFAFIAKPLILEQ